MGVPHAVSKMKEAITLTVLHHQTLYDPAVLNEKQHQWSFPIQINTIHFAVPLCGVTWQVLWDPAVVLHLIDATSPLKILSQLCEVSDGTILSPLC